MNGLTRREKAQVDARSPWYFGCDFPVSETYRYQWYDTNKENRGVILLRQSMKRIHVMLKRSDRMKGIRY
jgi:hypothetical protein